MCTSLQEDPGPESEWIVPGPDGDVVVKPPTRSEAPPLLPGGPLPIANDDAQGAVASEAGVSSDPTTVTHQAPLPEVPTCIKDLPSHPDSKAHLAPEVRERLERGLLRLFQKVYISASIENQ